MTRQRQKLAGLVLAGAAAMFAQSGYGAPDAAGRQSAAAELSRAEALRMKGRKEDVPTARALYRRAADMFREAHDGCGERRALIALSGFEHDASYTAEQRSAAEAALRVPCVGDIEQQALAERLLGSAYINSGDYSAGARETERAVTLFRRIGDAPGETAALRNLGLAYEESGELGKALATVRRALAGAERIGDTRLLALLRNDMALTYSARGEFARAADAYHKSLAALAGHPYPMAEAVAWINLGVAYGQLGDAEQATSAFERGESASTQANCWSCLAEIDADRGDDLLDASDAVRAAAAYQAALAIAAEHQLVRQRAEALRGLGRCAIATGRWSDARSLLAAARGALQGTSERLNEALIDVALGDLDDRLGRTAAAAADYGRALQLARGAANETWQAAALASLARVELESGQLVRARGSIAAAVALIESERTRIDAPELRTSYFGTKRSYYGLYIDILMQLEHARPGRGYAADALAVAERARARQLQDELEARAIDLRHHVAPALLAAESTAADGLHALAWQLSRASASEAARRSTLERDIDQASRDLDEARGRIRAADPRYAELVHPAPLSLEEIQRHLLDPETSVLEYWLGERASYLWVVNRGTLRAVALRGRETIDAAASDFRARVLAPVASAASTVPIERRSAFDAEQAAAGRVSAARLADELVPAQVRGLLRQVIAVVPDGELERIPFALLLAGADRSNGDTGSGAAAAVVYLPSIRTLRSLRALPASSAPRRALAVLADPVFRADDVRLTRSAQPGATRNALLLQAAGAAGISALQRLPYTRDEARVIAAFADPRRSWVALDFAASRSAALQAPWHRYSVIHFATHALLNSRHPELSGIVLSLYDSRAHPEDGFLRASDIYGLDMPADLVVLSVCDSAVGKDVGAEGPANLARALFYAGAHRVLASLWAVDDRASVAFMQAFYRSLFERGEPAIEALADAQREVRSNARWRLPYYWAAYVLEGDWR